ncbi:hypothetical protein BDY19DRAFT_1036822 [Irpex rosettiformis]|uniref:Uncharacterized protein n=1 Tax=Irpex rosettiformis TaxID=378272 RepID=A0ACB8U8B1_9APHY|nr:hypothetical protein BDY19DRAFT_1036822 [Irpex rosettiformis]
MHLPRGRGNLRSRSHPGIRSGTQLAVTSGTRSTLLSIFHHCAPSRSWRAVLVSNGVDTSTQRLVAQICRPGDRLQTSYGQPEQVLKPILHRPPDVDTCTDAQELIKAISSRKVVRKLLLDRVHLPGDGWIQVFEYLDSLPSLRPEIREIDLRSCNLKDRDLVAISQFLSNNSTLNSLWLQNNCFDFSTETAETFIAAINSSRLGTLRLSSNPNLNGFVPRLLRGLDTMYLNILELSMMKLDAECAPHLSDYLASPRCHLHTLHINANKFLIEDIQIIHHGLRLNYSLTALEIHSVILRGDDDREAINKYFQERVKIQTRNQILRQRVAVDALHLLRHSRAALLPSLIPLATPTIPPPHKLLPPEIILHILSFFAPILSASQRIRIFTYASTRSTLPPILPRLPVRKCLPDPSAPPSPNEGCSENCCMGPALYLSCRRQYERMDWLREMHCDIFDSREGPTTGLEWPTIA